MMPTGNPHSRPKLEKVHKWAVVVNGVRRVDFGIHLTAASALNIGRMWSAPEAKIEAEPVWLTIRHSHRVPLNNHEPQSRRTQKDD